jgi:uncharacterized protein YbjQ (UPF0145 family)
MEKETTPDVETKEIMQKFGEIIGKLLPGFGFFLMVFAFNSKGRANYISNAQRKDVINAMKEFIERTEATWMEDNFDGEYGVGKKEQS